MKINSHFNLGEKAWSVYGRPQDVFVDCPSCESGKINLKDGKTLECPRCLGKGAIAERSAHKFFVGNELTVGQLRFEIDKDDTKESYMCEETGIGSGSIHSIDSLYKSSELAQAECDKRNSAKIRTWACIQCNPVFAGIHYSIGFAHREWRYCAIHKNAQHVDEPHAVAVLAAREAGKEESA